jgi:hypothetical protein
MEYRISVHKQMGPYSPHQLRRMWDHGELSANTYYYDELRAEWLPLRDLVESTRNLFTVEEAFVRVGQSRLKGCLCVFNKEEIMRLFVDGGYVVSALGDMQEGEFALSRALSLEDATYEWILGEEPLTSNLRLNINEFVLKHAIARDVHIGSKQSTRQQTVILGKNVRDKISRKPGFTLRPAGDPTLKLQLVKMTNIVGRELQCDVVIDHLKVSRRHCLLEVSEQTVKVKDLESSNGTYVNGISIRDGVLKVGDQLSLGGYQLILHKDEENGPG